MQPLTLQIHHNTEGWLTAAQIAFHSARKVEIEYDLDYAARYFGRMDRYAISLCYPVDTLVYRGEVPGFMTSPPCNFLWAM